ncbi:phosphoenolpyruvate--protein phosphotransferase [Pseudahrensia aquimaris]|uniref:phosphoenolpyruvate--protein phosphotransferase n=1 Tax=Pseudahrensia aquimaris TaxID=744461 RepID=A0ABW3FC63_9HYPH
MPGVTTGPRVLLKHLREAMAEPIGPQERLDRIVQQIASAMSAEVCSVYVLRDDDVLELFATHGLNADAVHQSQLKVGQGLVGKIARIGRPLNVEDAFKHPAFTYLPEVGEDEFHAFLGVPMKRAGRPMGVLVVQRKATAKYPIEEVEALETAAMVLSDLVASGDLIGLTQSGKGLDLTRPISLHGTGLSRGIGIGSVVLHEPRVLVTRLFNDDAQDELRRLASAIQSLRESFDQMVDRGEMAGDGDHVDVLETLRMFAHDRGWVRRIEAAISDGLTAEAATEKVAQENRARMQRSPNAYIRERLNDFDDLARRLMRKLVGKPDGEHQITDGKFAVVASSMTAAELLDYDSDNLVGLVLEEATTSSHVVIVARALGIAVVQCDGAVARAENGDAIIVDGDDGSLHLRPVDDLAESYSERIGTLAEREARFEQLRELPNESRDGVAVDLLINAGLAIDLKQLERCGAVGIGLFRTELQFMIASKLPKLGEQEQFYREVMQAVGDKPVTFRTLDVGGDKVLPYLQTVKEENPAMGWRAIRIAIDRPGLLRVQLRALLRAAAGRTLRIKLPMVTTVAEVVEVRHLLNREIATQKRFGHTMPKEILMGSMIEVPSLLWQLDELMRVSDFVSVGTNDLFQFISASDRGNTYLANRYSSLSRPFLRVLRQIVQAAQRHNTPLHLCGEMSSQPLSAMALLAIGYRALSMPPGSVGPVKEMLRTLDVSSLSPIVRDALDDTEPMLTLREILIDYADQHGIPL